MPTGENLGDLADRRADLIMRGCLHIDLVYVTGQPPLQAVRVWRRRIDPIDRLLLLARRSDAKHFALSGSKGNHHDIVLVRAKCRLSLRAENADHAHGYTLD